LAKQGRKFLLLYLVHRWYNKNNNSHCDDEICCLSNLKNEQLFIAPIIPKMGFFVGIGQCFDRLSDVHSVLHSTNSPDNPICNVTSNKIISTPFTFSCCCLTCPSSYLKTVLLSIDFAFHCDLLHPPDFELLSRNLHEEFCLCLGFLIKYKIQIKNWYQDCVLIRILLLFLLLRQLQYSIIIGGHLLLKSSNLK
jgi:hypothetical protein